MTGEPEPPRDAPPERATQLVWSSLQRLVLIAAALSVLWNPIVWFTGGLHPQSSIDLESLKTQTSDLRTDLAATKARLDQLPRQADVEGLRTQLAGIQARIEQLPRSTDFQDWTAHLSRLDAVFEGLRDQVVADRLAAKETAVRVQSLTALPSTRQR